MSLHGRTGLKLEDIIRKAATDLHGERQFIVQPIPSDRGRLKARQGIGLYGSHARHLLSITQAYIKQTADLYIIGGDKFLSSYVIGDVTVLITLLRHDATHLSSSTPHREMTDVFHQVHQSLSAANTALITWQSM